MVQPTAGNVQQLGEWYAGARGLSSMIFRARAQMLFVLGVLAHAATRIRQRGRPLEKVAIALAIFWIPHALAIYHGDALGVERHSMTLAAHARIIFWITAAIVVDRIVNNMAQRQTT